MGKNNVLYDRNHVKRRNDNLDLYIDGSLPNGTVTQPYEGRVQIHNNVGACSVKLLDNNLPVGANVYVDNTTYEVVVAWAGVVVPDTALENPGFETGDTSGWTYVTKGGNGTLVASTQHVIDGSYSAYWAGGKGLGSEGGIECLAENNTAAKVSQGQTVSAKVRILYNPDGGTPKGSRGQCRLHWYNKSGTKIGSSDGFLVKTRAFNGRVTDSVVTAKVIPGADTVKLAAWVTATGKGHTYFDSAEWSVPQAGGPDEPSQYHLCVEVTDSAGRKANWCGTITVDDFVYATWDPTDTTDQTSIGWYARVSENGFYLSTAGSGNFTGCRATKPISGRQYLEFKITHQSTNDPWKKRAGLCDGSLLLTNNIGGNNLAVMMQSLVSRIYAGGSFIYSGPTLVETETIYRVCVDSISRKIWMAFNNGPWIGGGDPVNNTSPTYILSGSNDIYPVGSIEATGNARIISNPSELTYNVPTTYSTGIIDDDPNSVALYLKDQSFVFTYDEYNSELVSKEILVWPFNDVGTINVPFNTTIDRASYSTVRKDNKIYLSVRRIDPGNTPIGVYGGTWSRTQTSDAQIYKHINLIIS